LSCSSPDEGLVDDNEMDGHEESDLDENNACASSSSADISAKKLRRLLNSSSPKALLLKALYRLVVALLESDDGVDKNDGVPVKSIPKAFLEKWKVPCDIFSLLSSSSSSEEGSAKDHQPSPLPSPAPKRSKVDDNTAGIIITEPRRTIAWDGSNSGSSSSTAAMATEESQNPPASAVIIQPVRPTQIGRPDLVSFLKEFPEVMHLFY
jgi:hypothetical protein